MGVIHRLILSSLLVAGAANGEMWPGVSYRESTPTMEEILGHSVGHEISNHAAIRRYFEALQQAHPDQVRLIPYANSWQGRELFYAIIGSRENMARLGAIESAVANLDSANLEELPGIAWLSYSVHGNEISSSDAALFFAYHLLAARDDPTVGQITTDALVFIDPLQNPDGRDRFIHAFEQARGLLPDSDRQSAEHHEPWPSGRVNHYLFDLNRDWLALTQPETQGRVREIQRWSPLAFVDVHEMGSDSTYFFAPEAIPYNPHITATQRVNLERFGRNNAHWFDQFGINYFTRDVFDAFYPGYGASWPAYHGAVAMTYEQASARGLVVRRTDGSEFSYQDSVRHHFVSSVATAQTVAANKETLWSDLRDYRKTARDRNDGPAAYIIPTQVDQGAADKLAGVLAQHGVRSTRVTASFAACGRDYSDGAVVISMRQPASRLARTLLDPQVDMEPAFLAEQERLRSKDLEHDIYDVTAWSLPLMFNVEVDSCGKVPTVDGQRVEPETVRPGKLTATDNAIAWLIPGGDRNTNRFLALAFRAGWNGHVVERPFVLGNHRHAAGTLVYRKADNPDLRREDVEQALANAGVDGVEIDDSWVTEGTSLGSRYVRPLIAPRVAMAWDTPTSPYSAGATRFVLERQFGYPVTAIRTSRLRDADLARYDVVIIPDGNWEGEDSADGLSNWVVSGGVLITLGSAADFAISLGLTDLVRERQAQAEEAVSEDDESAEDARVDGLVFSDEDAYLANIRPSEEDPDELPGVLVRGVVDADHWLSAGVAERVNILARGIQIYRPLATDEGANVVRFAARNDLLVSGYGWEDTLDQLAFKPFVTEETVGQGRVIHFTQDPNVRAYLDGLNALFVGAVLRGASYSDRLR